MFGLHLTEYNANSNQPRSISVGDKITVSERRPPNPHVPLNPLENDS